jgi:hypothetical protein
MKAIVGVGEEASVEKRVMRSRRCGLLSEVVVRMRKIWVWDVWWGRGRVRSWVPSVVSGIWEVSGLLESEVGRKNTAEFGGCGGREVWDG